MYDSSGSTEIVCYIKMPAEKEISARICRHLWHKQLSLVTLVCNMSLKQGKLVRACNSIILFKWTHCWTCVQTGPPVQYCCPLVSQQKEFPGIAYEYPTDS